MPGHRHLLVQLGLDLVGQPLRRRDQHAGGQRVVLGLADQVGGDVRRVGGVVGEDRDLGRPGLGVDADHALEQPLGGDGVDVAGPGDQVDPAAGSGAVGEHRDRLGAADGVHLVDPEQRAGGQDRRVRQPAVLPLRRRGERDRARRRRPGRARRSSPRWRPAARPRRARRGRPARPAPSGGSPWRRAPRSVTTSRSSSASQVARSRRIDSSSPARTAGSSAASASSSGGRGTTMSVCSTPSNRRGELEDRVDARGRGPRRRSGGPHGWRPRRRTPRAAPRRGSRRARPRHAGRSGESWPRV